MAHTELDLRERRTIKDSPDVHDKWNPKSDMTLEHIKFGYFKDQALFEDLSLTFKGDQTTAIVGTTGSGKTTILNLLTRLHEPWSDEAR